MQTLAIKIKHLIFHVHVSFKYFRFIFGKKVCIKFYYNDVDNLQIRKRTQHVILFCFCNNSVLKHTTSLCVCVYEWVGGSVCTPPIPDLKTTEQNPEIQLICQWHVNALTFLREAAFANSAISHSSQIKVVICKSENDSTHTRRRTCNIIIISWDKAVDLGSVQLHVELQCCISFLADCILKSINTWNTYHRTYSMRGFTEEDTERLILQILLV